MEITRIKGYLNYFDKSNALHFLFLENKCLKEGIIAEFSEKFGHTSKYKPTNLLTNIKYIGSNEERQEKLGI